MTSDNRGRRIVVGYDGSPASRAALAHAARRAGEEGQRVVALQETRETTGATA